MKGGATVSPTALYPAPAGLGRRLRVVLVAPRRVPGWLRAFRDLALRNEWIELSVVPGVDATLPKVSDISLGLRLFLAWERCLHWNANASLEPETIATDPTPAIEVATPDALQARVGALRPDLVLVAGPESSASALARHATLGCWHLDANLTDRRYAGLPLLASLLRGEAATQVQLVLQGPAGEPVDLAGSSCRTRRLSFLRTRDDAFRKLPPLLLRALLRVADKGPASRASPSTLQLRPYCSPSRGVASRLLVSTFCAQVHALVRRFVDHRWTLVVRQEALPLDPAAPVMGSHAILKAAEGWWADPCVVAAEGRALVFVEEMDLAAREAAIACVELGDGGARRLGIALKERGHLSFPQVFRWEGQWHMTVESGYAKRASLYRASRFPLEWTRVQDLVTGWVCVDPVLHRHGDHWYLFVNVAESGNSTSDDLFLFVAEGLQGPFRPHPQSPIVCDVRRSRMAGRVFSHQGRLIRPSQDCGPNYGSAIVFNEVLELAPDVYRERPMSRLAPDFAPGLDGCHTYNTNGAVEVMDLMGRPPAGSVFMKLIDDGSSDVALETASTPADPTRPPYRESDAHDAVTGSVVCPK